MPVMSTKNLARTVIEGGRSGYYKSDVSERAGSERAAGRAYLRLVSLDPGSADDLADPRRHPVSPHFSDKLSPVYAYLDSRVGKSWNKTYAEVRAKFDLRTTPGRHITNDHLLAVVARSGEHTLPHHYHRYFVDKHGILRKAVRDPRVHSSPPKPFDSKRLIAWLGDRKVGQQGERFFWWVPVDKDARVQARWETFHGLKYVELDEHGEVVMTPRIPRSGFGWEPRFVPSTLVGAYRPAGLLKREDEAYFLSLSEGVRKNVLAAAPSHGDPKGPVFIDRSPTYV